jgi:alkaline phosphatase D|tara:strand:- start:2751 stop:3140 length:390 start_codon:yes stop_codon:yes gene_type:complete
MPIPGTTKNIFSRFAKGLLCAGIIAAIVASCSSDDEDAAPHASNYGVASGDPKADGMILWTRITLGSESPDEITVTWEIAEWSSDESMSNVIITGNTTTDASQNYTVKVDTEGLAANQRYNYRFRVGDV